MTWFSNPQTYQGLLKALQFLREWRWEASLLLGFLAIFLFGVNMVVVPITALLTTEPVLRELEFLNGRIASVEAENRVLRDRVVSNYHVVKKIRK